MDANNSYRTTETSQGVPHIERLDVLVPWTDQRSTYEKFTQVARDVGGRVTVFTVIGTLLIILGPLSTAHAVEAFIVHLGGAFVIAGLVHFGIEWGREVHDARVFIANLVGKLSRFETKILGAATRESVRNGMMQLMNDDTQTFAEQFPQVGEYIGHLRLRGGLPGEACIAYLEAFQSQLTTRAAELARLTLNTPYAPNLDVRIDLPDTLVLVDALVSRLMEGLLRQPARAEYVAVSDVSTWLNLQRLAATHSDAIKSVKTRRVFVLGLNSDKHLSAELVHKILSDHIQSAIDSKYEMRLLMLDDYPRASLLELAEAKHFGIFFPHEHQALALIARDDGISRLRLITARDEMRHEFDTIWVNAEPVTATRSETEPTIPARDHRTSDVVLDDHLMAYFISRPSGDIDYHGISNMSSWLRNDYRVFFRASQKSFLRDGARAKRIFVMDGVKGSDPRVQAVIEQHTALSKRTGGNYQFVFCHADDAQTFPERIPIGFLKSIAPNEPDKIIVNRAQPRSFQPASDEQNQQLVAAFDELWNTHCRKTAD